MSNLIATIILALVVGGAALYIYKARKKGAKCIGCPDAYRCGKTKASPCSGNCSRCSGCH